MAVAGLLRTSVRTCSISVLLLVVAFQQHHRCHGDLVTLQPIEAGDETTVATTTQWQDYEEDDDSIEETYIDDDAPLMFHSHCGDNAVVSLDGKTVRTLWNYDDVSKTGAITNRPLKDNEIFEIVHRDRPYGSTSRTEYVFDMGVTEFSPQDLKEEGFPHRMAEIESGDWISNWTIPVDLTNGDHVGMARLENGTLRVYVNDLDLGEVATGVPEKVYGYVEIYSGDDIEISIVDPYACVTEGLENMNPVARRMNQLICAWFS